MTDACPARRLFRAKCGNLAVEVAKLNTEYDVPSCECRTRNVFAQCTHTHTHNAPLNKSLELRNWWEGHVQRRKSKKSA